jgi:hypothetical protein
MVFWKRVEIYCGYSITEFTDLKDALIAHGISYDERKVNHRLTNDQKHHTQYYLYVHNKDFDKSMFCTSNRKVS